MSKSRKSIVTLALSFLIVFCVVLVPVKAMAAEGKISYLEEIQSVSTGDAQPYALMTLNEDYGVAAASTAYPNAFQDFSKTVFYSPSYYITGDVLTTSIFEGNLNTDYSHNLISLFLPVQFSGIAVGDNLTKYELWLIYGGKKYTLGTGPWCQVLLDSNFGANPYIQIGVDLYFSTNYSNSYGYNSLPITGSIGGDSRTDDISDGVYITTYDQNVGLKVDSIYITEILKNRPNYHPITISMTGGSYATGYHEREEIGLIKQFKQAMQDQIYSLNVNVTNGLNYVRDIIVTKVDEFIGVINTKFTELFTKMEEDQEELINGYQGTGTSDASSRFDQSAGELENVESDLTNITNSSIDNYTDTAFDTSVIASLGSSLVYVVTWFTNFWNMGGLFTSILNVGLALSVAFFILRLRGGS